MGDLQQSRRFRKIKFNLKRAYIRVCEDINEIAKAINLMIVRFINPYKINEFVNKNKSNDMEYDMDNNRNTIFNEEHKINPSSTDEKRILSQKTKFWPKDYEMLEIENVFTLYLTNNVFSLPCLNFAAFIFESLINNFFKRREFINKKISSLSKEAAELNNNIANTNNNFYQPRSKKIINDEEDEESVDLSEENDSFSKKDSNHRNNNNFNYSEEPNSKRLRNKISVNNKNNFIQENAKKKKSIDWSEACYICNDFGDLICCEECTNVVHLFCATLNV